MAAYGEDSSLSDLTFIPPVTLANVSLPVKSVIWMKVSFQVDKMWATPNTNSFPATLGPKVATTYYVVSSPVFFPFFPFGYWTGYSFLSALI